MPATSAARSSAVGGAVMLPTGKESLGLGNGYSVFEPLLLAGQMLGANGFVQLQAGYEIASDRVRGANEAFARTAIGYTWARDAGRGRAWTPMAEVMVARPSGGPGEWDVVPQAQVSLSKLQHVLMNVGVRVPLTQRDQREAAAGHLFVVGLVRRRPVPVLEVGACGCASWLVSGRLVGVARSPRRLRRRDAAAARSVALRAFRRLPGLPQQPDLAGGRGRLDRRGWRATMMANSARDPYWQASVRRETLDHPAHAADIQDECGGCHMPMAAQIARAHGGKGEVFAHLPVRGADVPRFSAWRPTACPAPSATRSPRRGWHDGRFNGRFAVTPPSDRGVRRIFGPFEVDAGRQTIMRSVTGYEQVKAPHIRESELCASCHTLITTALGADGEVIGSLPEQMNYQEWRHSAFAAERKSCQSCHMPRVAGPVRVASVLGEGRDGLSRHAFVGGNAHMLRLLNRSAATWEWWPSRRSSKRRPSPPSGSCNRTPRRCRSRSRPGAKAVWRSTSSCEPDRPQVPDRLSVTPRLAARGRDRRPRDAGLRVRRRARRRLDRGQRRRRRRAGLRAAPRHHYPRRPGPDLRAGARRPRSGCRRPAC